MEENDTLNVAREVPITSNRTWRFVVGGPEVDYENDPMWMGSMTPTRLPSNVGMSFMYEEGVSNYEEAAYLPVVSTPSEVINIPSDDDESIDIEMEVDIISISSDSDSDSDSESESESESEDIGILPANSSLDHGDDEVFCMNMNACVRCAVDLGDMNPRQLCGKTFCYNMNY